MIKPLIASFMLAPCFYLLGQETTILTTGNDLLQKAVQETQSVGMAAGFSVNGVLKWQGGAGFSDEDNKKPFDASTLTRIASIAKPMTAFAIMQLYEQGKLDLDKQIQAYLPAFLVKKEGTITIRHLLQHSSGLDGNKSEKEQENKTNYPGLADAVSIFKDRDLISEPGKAFHYTTYGYVVLGLVIEQVSGMSYESYMQQNIWDRVLSNTSGAMQRVSNITVQLFDVAAGT